MLTGNIHLAAPRRRHGTREPPPLRRPPERLHGDAAAPARPDGSGALERDRKRDAALHDQKAQTHRRYLSAAGGSAPHVAVGRAQGINARARACREISTGKGISELEIFCAFLNWRGFVVQLFTRK